MQTTVLPKIEISEKTHKKKWVFSISIVSASSREKWNVVKVALWHNLPEV